MKFSVVMQSFLGYYPTAAKDRDKKFVRAVNSVIGQTFTDWELIIISDGCSKTAELFAANVKDQRVRLSCVRKQKMWSGTPRNMGIRIAKGKYILYLDTDDMFTPDHLQVISDQINGEDWVYFNDMVYDKRTDDFRDRVSEPGKLGMCGTSNICHKRSMGEIWTRSGYAREDLAASKVLKQMSDNCKQIDTPGYLVCHIPKRYDI